MQAWFLSLCASALLMAATRFRSMILRGAGQLLCIGLYFSFQWSSIWNTSEGYPGLPSALCMIYITSAGGLIPQCVFGRICGRCLDHAAGFNTLNEQRSLMLTSVFAWLKRPMLKQLEPVPRWKKWIKQAARLCLAGEVQGCTLLRSLEGARRLMRAAPSKSRLDIGQVLLACLLPATVLIVCLSLIVSSTGRALLLSSRAQSYQQLNVLGWQLRYPCPIWTICLTAYELILKGAGQLLLWLPHREKTRRQKERRCHPVGLAWHLLAETAQDPDRAAPDLDRTIAPGAVLIHIMAPHVVLLLLYQHIRKRKGRAGDDEEKQGGETRGALPLTPLRSSIELRSEAWRERPLGPEDLIKRQHLARDRTSGNSAAGAHSPRSEANPLDSYLEAEGGEEEPLDTDPEDEFATDFTRTHDGDRRRSRSEHEHLSDLDSGSSATPPASSAAPSRPVGDREDSEAAELSSESGGDFGFVHQTKD